MGQLGSIIIRAMSFPMCIGKTLTKNKLKVIVIIACVGLMLTSRPVLSGDKFDSTMMSNVVSQTCMYHLFLIV